MILFFSKVAIYFACGIVVGRLRVLMNNSLLDRVMRPSKTFEHSGRNRIRLLHIDRGDSNCVREHDGTTMLLICCPGDGEIIVATYRVQFKLMKADFLTWCLLQDHRCSSITYR